MSQTIHLNLKDNLKRDKKYDNCPLRETLAKGLDPAKNAGLDPKKQKRRTKTNIDQDITAPVATLIVTGVVAQILANVNVLKIERENNLIEEERDNDTKEEIIIESIDPTIIIIIKFLLRFPQKCLCQFYLVIEEKGSVPDRP